MATEQYSIGYEEGYQAGWNAAMESLPAPVQQEACPTCGEYEPRTGTCGTSPNDKRALCNRNAPQPAQQTCNCRWRGEVQVQECTLHESHLLAIHEWAGRAKAAEAKLAALPAQQVTEAQVEAALKAACMHSSPESRKDMRRAIEAAHNIKEQP